MASLGVADRTGLRHFSGLTKILIFFACQIYGPSPTNFCFALKVSKGDGLRSPRLVTPNLVRPLPRTPSLSSDLFLSQSKALHLTCNSQRLVLANFKALCTWMANAIAWLLARCPCPMSHPTLTLTFLMFHFYHPNLYNQLVLYTSTYKNRDKNALTTSDT